MERGNINLVLAESYGRVESSGGNDEVNKGELEEPLYYPCTDIMPRSVTFYGSIPVSP